MADLPAHRVLRRDMEAVVRAWAAQGGGPHTCTILRTDFAALADAAAEAVPDPYGVNITVAHTTDLCPCSYQHWLPITRCRCDTIRCTLQAVDARAMQQRVQ